MRLRCIYCFCGRFTNRAHTQFHTMRPNSEKRWVRGTSGGRGSGSIERDPLGVIAALTLVPPLTDDPTVGGRDDASDERVWRHREAATLSERERALEALAIAVTGGTDTVELETKKLGAAGDGDFVGIVNVR